MSLSCGLTNDERRLGQRCHVLGCNKCHEFDMMRADSPAINTKAYDTQFAEAVLQNLRTALVMAEMLKDDATTVQIDHVLASISSAIRMLDCHIGELERRPYREGN